VHTKITCKYVIVHLCVIAYLLLQLRELHMKPSNRELS
jgi:hypothetical protein